MPHQTPSLLNKPASCYNMGSAIPTHAINLSQTYNPDQPMATTREVLVRMDTNEDMDDPKSKIVRIFAETALINLHHHCHPANQKPAIHQCRNGPIDVMAGSHLLASALTHTWILPFAETPLIKGDHCLLGLDFHPDILFVSMVCQPAQPPASYAAPTVSMNRTSTNFANRLLLNAIKITLLNAPSTSLPCYISPWLILTTLNKLIPP